MGLLSDATYSLGTGASQRVLVGKPWTSWAEGARALVSTLPCGPVGEMVLCVDCGSRWKRPDLYDTNGRH